MFEMFMVNAGLLVVGWFNRDSPVSCNDNPNEAKGDGVVMVGRY